MQATARAHTNIALIKYWGKRNDSLILPTNSSLSLTLDGFYTETKVSFRDDLTADFFLLDGEPVIGEQYDRVKDFLDLIRRTYDVGERYAEIQSINKVPTAAGFASSASGFAALAAATVKALELDIDDTELSRITRQGSGSACRSVFGGFVEWEMGSEEDGSDSQAVQIAPSNYWDLRVAAVVVDAKMKKVSSREGMKRTVDTSLFYPGWLEGIPTDMEKIKTAIREQNFDKLGSIAEANCLKMHATTLGATPPFTYWQDSTMAVMQAVQTIRDSGVPAYFTIDAGPNVKVLYLPEHEELIQNTLTKLSVVTEVVLSKSGEGISYV